MLRRLAKAAGPAMTAASSGLFPRAATPILAAQTRGVKTINGRRAEPYDQSVPLLAACLQAGAGVPHFCWHESLGVIGNCRMCYVATQNPGGAEMMMLSCVTSAGAVQDVRTVGAVQELWEVTLDIMLAEHPLDCPICDQGGQCDLQDMSMAFGAMTEPQSYKTIMLAKADDAQLSPLVSTRFDRCIYCSRCIVLMDRTGSYQLGEMVGLTIDTYDHSHINSPFLMSLHAVCPVGAFNLGTSEEELRIWHVQRVPTPDKLNPPDGHLMLSVMDGNVFHADGIPFASDRQRSVALCRDTISKDIASYEYELETNTECVDDTDVLLNYFSKMMGGKLEVPVAQQTANAMSKVRSSAQIAQA